jgi:hypothetical protein
MQGRMCGYYTTLREKLGFWVEWIPHLAFDEDSYFKMAASIIICNVVVCSDCERTTSFALLLDHQWFCSLPHE